MAILVGSFSIWTTGGDSYFNPLLLAANLLRLYRQTRGFGIFEPVKNFRSFKLAAPDQWPFLIAKELTRDHHPDRDDERSRVETAGGHVSKWGGIARVNGQLAVSRAIGDVYFKR